MLVAHELQAKSTATGDSPEALEIGASSTHHAKEPAMKRLLASVLVLSISAWLTTAAVAEEEATPAAAETPAAMSDTGATQQSPDSTTGSSSDGTIMATPDTDSK